MEHDCHIGENSFICPGSIILGSSKIGKNTIIGQKTLYYLEQILKVTLL